MLSTFPAFDGGFHSQFPAFDGGFPPLDWSEIFPLVLSPNPVVSSSGSETGPTQHLELEVEEPETNQNPTLCSSGSVSGSDEPPRKPDPTSIDERKRRRMISNRESARRSRMRKQKHLEIMRNEVNRLRVENQELSNRLRFVLFHVNRVRSENEQLRSEHAVLRRKLSEIGDFLVMKRFQEQFSCRHL